MPTDYDAPRTQTDVITDEALEGFGTPRNDAQSADVELDEADAAESYELPGADLSGEEFSVRVVPRQTDEFTCVSCFLIHHRSRLAPGGNSGLICIDCAG